MEIAALLLWELHKHSDGRSTSAPESWLAKQASWANMGIKGRAALSSILT